MYSSWLRFRCGPRRRKPLVAYSTATGSSVIKRTSVDPRGYNFFQICIMWLALTEYSAPGRGVIMSAYRSGSRAGPGPMSMCQCRVVLSSDSPSNPSRKAQPCQRPSQGLFFQSRYVLLLSWLYQVWRALRIAVGVVGALLFMVTNCLN